MADEQGFDIHAFVVYLLKEHGPFEDTLAGFEERLFNDGGEYDIVLDPDHEKGTVTIRVQEHADESN